MVRVGGGSLKIHTRLMVMTCTYWFSLKQNVQFLFMYMCGERGCVENSHTFNGYDLYILVLVETKRAILIYVHVWEVGGCFWL